FRFRRILLLWSTIVFSLLVILLQVIFLIILVTKGGEWRVADACWTKLIGFMKVRSWRSPSVIYFLVLQLLVASIASIEIHMNKFGSASWQHSCWGHFSSAIEHLDAKWVRKPNKRHRVPPCRPGRGQKLMEFLFPVLYTEGYHFRVASCLLLPVIQLVVGISSPSWVSLPFFICSCVGLVDWSMTSNFLGLFRWWKPLWLYAGFKICLLYVYQLPIRFPKIFYTVGDFIGLYKLSARSEWLEICSGLSLMMFYFMLSSVKCDLEDMDFIMSKREGHLTEQLLPLKHSFFVRESRSGVRHTNVLIRGAVFRTFSINFFTYGFPICPRLDFYSRAVAVTGGVQWCLGLDSLPIKMVAHGFKTMESFRRMRSVSLFALSFWSFHFASVCAFGLLVYVGYVIYAFPSLFRLHRLNGLLLVFILLWAVGTFIFNVAFPFFNWKLGKDMEIWEMVGLWHYPIPGFFLLAQFCLGILVALGNLVNNSVFWYMTEENRLPSNGNSTEEVKEETTVLIVATIAWGLRKCSRAIMLVLIFLIAMKPGFIHAVYIIFFLMYLLSHHISKRTRQALILLCETHFALLYALQLNLVSRALEQKGSLSMNILSQLGLLERDSSWDFLEIALLACFCAIHNHGFEMLFSFSAIVQHTPCTPVGFSILRAGLNKSVLLSVYASPTIRNSYGNLSHERKIASYLGAIGQKVLSVYRSFGTYIAFITILIAVYLVRPNYVSFGYMFLLLIWITGRQLVERTKQRLWFPLKAYAVLVFIFIYILSIFPSFESWVARELDLYSNFGYNPEASLLENVWESLAILIVMQLYSYERRKSKSVRSEKSSQMQYGIVGFLRRLLIWHSQKILFIALLYSSLSPISAFGLLYLFGLVICSTLPKTSRVPSKLFLVYTGFLVTAEYLFQMWGKQAGMFPGQKHYNLSCLLGFQLYKPGFWGLEVCLRGKILVIAACTLQYNVFHWLEDMSSSLVDVNRWEEPCPLFVSTEEGLPIVISDGEKNQASDSSTLSAKRMGVTNNSWPSLSHGLHQSSYDVPGETGASESCRSRKYSFGYIWGSTKESHKWNKKRILALRKERFETQKTALKIYLKFWMENMFNLFGLEINMIALLLASFALLNAVSLLYIASLAACVLLDRRMIRKLWPMFVFLFASILVIEYFAIWKSVMPLHQDARSETSVSCRDCWRSSNTTFHYCINCWLGFTVDDPRMLISYCVVFMFACFKLRADRFSSFSGSFTYRQMISQRKIAFVWRDLSFETKGMWTFLDYMRLYCYCHLLDLVLALILITGTLEYDILHLGYLGFALTFFRMRLTILKKKNKIFSLLRIYNFAVIVLSLAYQSPFVGDSNAGKCETIDYIYGVIGFYKYDYGFRITSRSALVEIVIFVLVSLQSYMFSSREFDYVFRYLEAEQIGAVVREQEKKTAWKTAQLKHIRESEENKRQRNLQVEKMKSEMLSLQIQLHSMNTATACGDTSPISEGLRRRRATSLNLDSKTGDPDREEGIIRKQENPHVDPLLPFELHESPTSSKTESPLALDSTKHSMGSPLFEITELGEDAVAGDFFDLDKEMKRKGQAKGNPLVSAAQLVGDGVSQVQSFGNQAVVNLVNLLNIAHDDSGSDEPSPNEDEKHNEVETRNKRFTFMDRSSSLQSDKSRTMSDTASPHIGRIFRHIWAQMRANNDIVCYCCFVLVFLWNFSLLSMVYLAALFLYALCVNTGPSYIFWVVMLIYTEIYILLQYVFQIFIQHCGLSIQSTLLFELGFPTKRIKSSFVISLLPLFFIYLFTLIQSSITAKDSEWISWTGFKTFKGTVDIDRVVVSPSWSERTWKLLQPIADLLRMVIRNCSRYWKSLTREAESPPYFLQLSLDVHLWPEDGIQPERIESGINQLLKIVHDERCKEANPNDCPCASKVQVQSIEKSTENPNMALAIFEVVYASPWTECTLTERYKSLTPAADVAKEILQAQSAGLVEEVGFPYSIISVIGGGRRELDLYAYVFGADLSVFFLVAIFYQSVIKNKSEFLEVYQLEDQFPKEFVFMLMIIFFLIVLDRIIYLCSFATGKVIFYVFNLVLYTYSVTEYAWNMDPSKQHAAGLALRAIYLTKTMSLALQAIQIRYGVPHRSTLYQQFLTSSVSRVNYFGYRLYRALPFLYELRCVLDWSCTTTSLTMYDWLKLEDINASLYLVKSDTVLNRAAHKQGEKQTKVTKFCNGICLFFILICVIWAPMLIYSSGNPTNIANPINDASVQFDIKTEGGRLTIYQTTLCKRLAWDQLHSVVNLDPQGYLDAYNEADIQLICCQADASVLWLVPDVVQERFIQSLNDDMNGRFSWVLTRARPKGKEVVKYERTIDLPDLPQPLEIEEVLNGSINSFRIYNLYPRYFRVTGSGDVRPLGQKVNDVRADLYLNRGNTNWWSFYDTSLFNVNECRGLKGPMAIIISEETPRESSFSFAVLKI
ncbi:hypothetical protein RJ639_000385, partial [Escallonia herrerae]